MERKNFEKWWSENLFSGKTEYEHLGNKVRMPSIDEFSESWMGSISEKDRVKVRKHFKKYKSVLDVGCGGSPEFYGIQKFKKLQYTGLDITPEIVDFNLAPYYNERIPLIVQHILCMKNKNILLLVDRGYFFKRIVNIIT